MKNLTLILALLVSSSSLTASQSDGDQKEQQKKWPYFKGIVVDFVTRNPIAGVKAAIEGTKLEATTNEKGEFEFEKLAPGATSVLLTHPRYRSLLWENIPIANDQAFYQFLTMKVGSTNDKPLVGQYQMRSSSVIDEDAVPVQTREASYPLQALKDKVEGTVLLFVTVNETGEVLYASVKDSVREDLNLAALEAAQSFKFKPAKAKGKPVQATVTIPFNFKLADKSTNYPLQRLEGPLTPDDVKQALAYLGVEMERFTYDLPYKHKVKFWLDQYLDGKLADSKSYRVGQDPGKASILVLKHQIGDSIRYTVNLSSGNSRRIVSFGNIARRGYNSSGTQRMSDIVLRSDKKAPIYVYLSSPAGLSFKADDPLDQIISRIKMVIVISAELQLE